MLYGRAKDEARELEAFAFDYESVVIGKSLVIRADCFEWLTRIPENSIHGVVTDPPYGVKEYEIGQLRKRESGKGGVWRIPPAFDGHRRNPLPRFTALTEGDRKALKSYFAKWARLTFRVLRVGGHVFIACNAFLSQPVFAALVDGGLEFRGAIIRLVKTLRGGDRPKNAEQEFPDVCSLPRSSYEPWGLFRKPMPPGMTVAECLRKFGTGALRRTVDDGPFTDVIPSERTSAEERKMANHPSLKPQSFLRKIVYSALPLGRGIIVDPFMGSGSTVAACEAMGLRCIGVERHAKYFMSSLEAIPRLISLRPVSAEVETSLFEC